MAELPAHKFKRVLKQFEMFVNKVQDGATPMVTSIADSSQMSISPDSDDSRKCFDFFTYI